MKSKYSTLRKAFRWMDEDNDHQVSWEEVQRLLHNFNMDINDATLHALFHSADKDGSGQIDYDEFRSHIKKLKFRMGAKNIKRLLRVIDPNGSGSINRHEWQAFFEVDASTLRQRITPGFGRRSNRGKGGSSTTTSNRP